MTPNQLALLALVIAVVVALVVYYYNRRTAMAAIAIGAVVGLVVQAIFLMFTAPQMPLVAGLSAVAKGENPLEQYKFSGWMGLIYTVIIIVIVLIYAVRNVRVPAVTA